MTEAKLYEVLGRKQALLDSQDEAYTDLLNLLAGIVSGQIETSRVLVNLTDRSWFLAEQGQSPGMPATINGLPICVVAPAKSAA